jgi:L-serine deaminase
MDSFCWGYLKSKLYTGERFENLEVLKERIREEADAISLEMIRRAMNNFWARMEACITRGGRSVETAR